jgi:hypothetical protein
MIGDWRKLHNEGSHNLYSLPNITRIMKSMRIKWPGPIACIGRIGMHRRYWWKIYKGRDHYEDLNVGGIK